MKTNLLMFSVVMLVSLDVAAKHDLQNPQLLIDDEDVYKVVYDSKNSQSRITLFNESGKVIYSDALTHSRLSKALTDSVAPQGNYSIEYTDADNQLNIATPYKVEVKKVLNDSDRIIQISNTAGDDEKFILAITKAQNESYLVDIYDATHGIKHEDTLLV